MKIIIIIIIIMMLMLMMFVLCILWYVFVFVNQFGKFFYSFAQITHSNTHNSNNNNNLVRYSGKTVAETMEVLISIK